ncbi:MAG: hypothetical protein Q8Q94_02560 [bacterium]|nr:hypothetical protein [bacterium]
MGKQIILFVVALGVWLVIVLPLVLRIGGVDIFKRNQTSTSGQPKVGSEPLLRSRDGGVSWEGVSRTDATGTTFPTRLTTLVYNPRRSEVLYLGTRGAGLWKSEKNGDSWTLVYDEAGVLKPTADVFRVAMSAASSSIVYAAIFQDKRGRVVRSDDEGRHFREVYFVSADNLNVSDLWVNPASADHVRITTGQGGMLESEDGGATWRVVRWFDDPLVALAIEPSVSGSYFVVTDKGTIFRTRDAGVSFTNLEDGLAQIDAGGKGEPVQPGFLNPFSITNLRVRTISAFLKDPSIVGRLYLGLSDGLFRSDDGGGSWARIKVLIPPTILPIDAVAVNPTDANTLYVGAGTQLYKSTDGGIAWNASTFPTTLRVRAIVPHPGQSKTFFGIFGG